MALIGFDRSHTFDEASSLTLSNPNVLYFPLDDTSCTFFNGKKYGHDKEDVSAIANTAVKLTNESLDDIRTAGAYYAQGSNSVTNKPSGVDAFSLVVRRSAGSYYIQELTSANMLPMYKYIRQYGGSTWSGWTQMKYTDSDTKNTAGSTNTSSKIFLVGATSQAANPQTYSHDTAFVGTDGCLYSGGAKVLTAHQALDYINNLGLMEAAGGADTFSEGLRLYKVYNNGYPTMYGNVLRIGGSGKGELLCAWTGSEALGRVYYRSRRDVSAAEWSEWGTLAFLTDIPTALKSPQALKVGTKSYDGSAAVTVTMADLMTSAGVLEAGRYIDFHSANFGANTTEDYTARIDAGAASTARVLTLPAKSGTLALNTLASASANGLMSATDYQAVHGVDVSALMFTGKAGDSFTFPLPEAYLALANMYAHSSSGTAASNTTGGFGTVRYARAATTAYFLMDLYGYAHSEALSTRVVRCSITSVRSSSVVFKILQVGEYIIYKN